MWFWLENGRKIIFSKARLCPFIHNLINNVKIKIVIIILDLFYGEIQDWI